MAWKICGIAYATIASGDAAITLMSSSRYAKGESQEHNRGKANRKCNIACR